MIRKITRGISSANGDKTISCSITNVDKVIVILNADISYYTNSSIALSGCSIYLKSVSNSNIIVNAKAIARSGSYTNDPPGYVSTTFSYQIIEFM